MTKRHPTPEDHDAPTVDPTDLLRAMLAISPEDAAAVREDAAKAMEPSEQSEKRTDPAREH